MTRRRAPGRGGRGEAFAPTAEEVLMATVAHARSPKATIARLVDLSDVWSATTAAVVSLTLGLFQLGQPSLWIDEAATFRAMSSSYTHLMTQHHWIYYTLMKPWTAAAGTTEVALRLPSVFAAAAACALLVPFGNRLLGRPVGSLAGLVLALNPFVVQWSQQARSYTIVMLAAIATTWLFVRLRADDSRRSWALYTVGLGLSVLLQPLSAGLLAAAHFLAARGFRVRIVAAGVAVMLATSLFLAGVAARDSSGGTLHWNVDPTVGSVSRAILELSGALGVGLALSLVGLALVRRERLLLGCWAFAPLVISVIVTPIGKVFVDRYLIVSAPAFALLVAGAIVELRGAWLAGAVGVFVAGTIAGLVIWYSPDGSQNWRGEDWKRATAFANARGGALTNTSFAEFAFEYYGGIHRKTGLVLVWSESGKEFAGHWPVDVSFGKRLRAQERGSHAG
jgi:mannosyltransferase